MIMRDRNVNTRVRVSLKQHRRHDLGTYAIEIHLQGYQMYINLLGSLSMRCTYCQVPRIVKLKIIV